MKWNEGIDGNVGRIRLTGEKMRNTSILLHNKCRARYRNNGPAIEKYLLGMYTEIVKPILDHNTPKIKPSPTDTSPGVIPFKPNSKGSSTVFV